MSTKVSPHLSLTLWLAAAAPTAGCVVQLTDFEALAESFEAELDGLSLGSAPTTSAPGAVFALVFTAP